MLPMLRQNVALLTVSLAFFLHMLFTMYTYENLLECQNNLATALQDLKYVRADGDEKQKANDELEAELKSQREENVQNAKGGPVNVQPSPQKSVEENLWLAIFIPTVPRPSGVSYLERTVETIAREIPSESDPMHGRIGVFVLNNRKGTHGAFTQIRQQYTDQEGLYFVEDHKRPYDSLPISQSEGDANHPGHKVQKQTLDVATALHYIRGRAKYVLFLEDDFLFCPLVFTVLHHVVSKANVYARDSGWSAIRFSFGLTGIMIHGEDVEVIESYLVEHYQRRPPDHLLVEWFASETPQAKKHHQGKIPMAYRYNVFDHIGKVSTLRSAASPPYPRCFEALGEPVLFEVEAFSERLCPNDDVWPCPSAEARLPAAMWAN